MVFYVDINMGPYDTRVCILSKLGHGIPIRGGLMRSSLGNYRYGGLQGRVIYGDILGMFQ